MKVDVHDRLEAIGPAAWTTLLAASRHASPFLSWTWQREWVSTFVTGPLEVRTVEDAGGELVAALPLYESAPGTFTLVGGKDISDYLDLIAVAGRELDAWTALLQSRGAVPAAWELHAVPAASPTVTALPGLGLAAVTATVEERCPVLALPESWEAYLARLNGKHRHEMTRKMRRLAREAPAAVVTSVARPEEIAARMGDFLDLHRRSRVGKDRFMDERMEAFFRRATAALAAEGAVRVWFLDTPEGPLASFITLEWSDTVGLYNSGFRPDAASLSPGLVLLAHLVQDAIARGKRRFDFLRGEERYKYEFEPTPEDVYLVRIP